MWIIVILAILIFSYLLELVVTYLNLQALSPQLPKEFQGVYEQEKYATSQNYTRENSRFSLIENGLTTIITITFLLLGGFNLVDTFARSFHFGSILTGLIFTGTLMALTLILSLPFSLYSTFNIEQRFGFNTTTPKIYCLDILKTILLGIVIGSPILSLILWFFEKTGEFAWVYCWIGVVLYSVILQFLAPVLIMPLYNKFTPLEEGTLKEKIMAYTTNENFKIQGVFTMDGSKRSNKLNAFFTGFGRFRKIVFFDTLMEKLSNEQIIAVLAHEMGHYKHHHLLKRLTASIFQTGLMFFFLSLVINNEALFQAFGMEHLSIYASLIFFGFLFTPISLIVSLIFNRLSRQHEYEADHYGATSTGYTEHLIAGLKTLSQENFSNLTPHPLNVLLHYSHPPVLERINALKKIKKNSLEKAQ